MHKYIFIGLSVVGALALASCQSNSSRAPQTALAPVQTAPDNNADPVGLNGKWVPTDPNAQRVYYNEFNNGKFRSKSPDGATTIASGNYKAASDGNIQMSWYSEARKAVSSATCRKLSDAEMQCTSNGSVFNLRRA